MAVRPGAVRSGWGALKASAAPRRVSQQSDDEEQEVEEEYMIKFDSSSNTRTERLLRFVRRSGSCAQSRLSRMYF